MPTSWYVTRHGAKIALGHGIVMLGMHTDLLCWPKLLAVHRG
jgi:hypothetical protein